MAYAAGSPPPGLRERKKQRTRDLIAEVALRLFSERGFEHVTVAEVARAAEVSEQTIFNHYPTKEDLVYWRMEAFEQTLLAAIRDREPGESVLAAFGRFVGEPQGLLAKGDVAARERLAAVNRMIAESPALLAREQRIFAGYTDSLAALIADEEGAKPGDIKPWVAANALIGIQRALVGYVRRRTIESVPHARIAREVRAHAQQALGLLEEGLGYDTANPGVRRHRARPGS
jgi:AcrR family transcriptional regulator